jgi:hypothetical protein
MEVIKDNKNQAKYIYDAAGNKVKAIVTSNNVATPKTEQELSKMAKDYNW